MAELFTNFSISEIILCVIGIVVAIEWFINIKNTFKTEFNKSVESQEHKDNIYNELKRRSVIQDGIKDSVGEITKAVNTINERIDRNTGKLYDVCDSSQRMENEIGNLSEVNRTIIKSYISDKRKQALKDGYITEYDLEICEKMFECYRVDKVEQPFIRRFMEELRALPNEKKE